eukprot:6469684-Amphidinium_carterae.1
MKQHRSKVQARQLHRPIRTTTQVRRAKASMQQSSWSTALALNTTAAACPASLHRPCNHNIKNTYMKQHGLNPSFAEHADKLAPSSFLQAS